jgi:hypothetical protein
MADNQTLTPELEILKFKKKFLDKYNQHLYIFTMKPESKKTDIEVFKAAAWEALIENHPEFKPFGSITAKHRKRHFVLYMQAMSFLARNEGYSYAYIAKSIDRTHATILNGVRQIENQLFTKNDGCKQAIINITKKLDNYVGIVPKDIEEQPDTKSNTDPIWDEARRFLAQSGPSR